MSFGVPVRLKAEANVTRCWGQQARNSSKTYQKLYQDVEDLPEVDKGLPNTYTMLGLRPKKKTERAEFRRGIAPRQEYLQSFYNPSQASENSE